MLRSDQLVTELERRLKKLDVHGAIEVLTYKRNRGFIVWKEAENVFTLREHGYESHFIEGLDDAKLMAAVKKIAKREFPRSTKLRLYTHAPGTVRYIKDQLDIRI